MKLHLPTRLRSAVIACITAVAAVASTVGTGVLATGAVAYTMAASQAMANVTGTTTVSSTTVEGKEYTGNVVIVSGNTADSTPLVLDAADTSVITSGRYKVNQSSDLAPGGTIVIAAGSYENGGAQTYQGGQLFVSAWNQNVGNTIANKLVLGTSNYSEGNYSGAFRLSDSTASKKIIFTGEVDIVQDLRMSVAGDYNYFDNVVNGAGKTITMTLSGTLNFGAGGSFGTLAQGDAKVVLSGTKSDGTGSGATYSLGSKTGNGNLTLNSGATLNLVGGTVNKLTMNGGSIAMAADSAAATVSSLTLSAAATVSNASTNALTLGDISGSQALTLSGSIALNGTVALNQAIAASGSTLTFGSNCKFDIANLTPTGEGVYTLFTGGTLTGFTDLTKDNILNAQAGYAYTFNDDGTVTAVLSSHELVWNGGVSGTWDDSTQNWLQGSAAAAFSEMDSVVFQTAGAQVTLAADHGVINMSIDADTAFSGAHTVTVDSLGGSGKLTIGEGTKVNVKGIKEGMSVSLGGSGTYALNTGAAAMGATMTADWTGTVALNTTTNAALVIQNLDLNTYGQAGSTVELCAIQGYLPQGTHTFEPNIVISNSPNGNLAGFEINNGYAGSEYTFNGTVSGTGNFITSYSGTNTYNFNGDMSGWTGTYRQTAGTRNVNFGAGVTTVGANMTVEGSATLNISGEEGLALKTVTAGGNGSKVKFASAASVETLSMGGGNVEAAADLSVATLNLGTASNANGKTLTLADNVQVSAKSLSNAWGGNVALGAGAALAVEGTANFSYGNNERTVSGAEDGTSVFSANQLTVGNASDLKFSNVQLVLGSGGFSRGGSKLTLSNVTVGASADWAGTGGAVTMDGTVTFNTDSHQVTINNVLQGTDASLVKDGEGTLVLNGANTYTGSTTVSAGTLKVASAGTLGTGAVTVADGAILDLGGSTAVASGATVTNNGTVQLHNTLTQGTISGGKLVLAADFAGISGAGHKGVEGGGANNGFLTGGTALVYSAPGALSGITTVDYGSQTGLQIQSDGTVSLGNDLSVYHITSALTEAETFNAISILGDGNLTAIDFGVADQVLKVELDIMQEVPTPLTSSMLIGEHVGSATVELSDMGSMVVDSDSVPCTVKIAEGSSMGFVTMAQDSTMKSLVLSDAACLFALEDGVTAAKLTLGSTLQGAGSLGAEEGVTVEVATVNVASGKAFTFFNGGTLNVTSTENRNSGLNITGGTVQLGSTVNVAGTLYANGGSAVTIGVEDDPAFVTVGRLEMGDSQSGNAPTLTVEAGSTLKVTGTDVSSGEIYKQTGVLLGEWGVSTTVAVSGTMMSQNATLQPGDVGYTLNVENGGLVAAKGIGNPTTAKSGKTQAIAVNVKEGGTLVLGEGGIASTHDVTTTMTGGTIGISAETVEITKGVVLDSGTNTLDTTLYAYTDTTVEQGEDVGTLTVSSVISGAGKLAAAGAGTLVLSGENTYQGGTDITEGTVNVTSTTGLGTGVTTVDGGALTLGAEGTTELGGLTLTTGSVQLAGAERLNVTGALTLSGGEMDLSNITVDGAGDIILATVGGAISVAEGVAITGISEEITSKYKLELLDRDSKLVLAVTDTSIPLFWNIGDGNWNSEEGNTPWGDKGDDTSTGLPYSSGVAVTISGTEGGTITVGGAQSAASLTVAQSGYTLAAAEGGSLSITGDLTVNEGKTFTLGFLPTVGGSMVVNEGSELDAKAVEIGNEAGTFNTILDKTTGDGTLKLQAVDGKAVVLTGNAEVKVANLDVTGALELNSWKTQNLGLTVGEGKTVTVHDGSLIVESTASLTVSGGTLDAQGGITLGHAEANHPGTLNMSAGEVKTTGFTLRDNGTQNVVNVTGGTLTITGASAFSQTTTGTTVGISGATLTNVDQDMSFNHSSTLTNATVDAKGDKTIKVGAAGTTTTLAGTLTTKGKVTLDGTLASTGLTGVVNSGALVSNSDLTVKGLNNTGTLAVTGTLTVADATTTGGETSATNVSVADNTTFSKLTVSGTATVTDGKVLTVGNQSTIGTLAGKALTVSGGTVTIQSATTLSTLANSGTLNVTGALTLTGAVTNGGTIAADSLVLSDDGKLTATGLTTASVKFGVIEKNAPLTLGTLAAKSGSVDFVVTEDDLKAMANGSNVTLATLENAYGSSLNFNSTGNTVVTIDDFKYTLALSDDQKSITLSAVTTTEGWKGGEGAKWDGTSTPWGEGDPATSTAKFLGNGTSAVVIEGAQSVKDVLVSTMLDGTKTQSYTFSGDALKVAEGINVNNGALVIDNATSVGGSVVVTESDAAAKSSIAVGEKGVLDITGNLTFTGADATVDNQGGMVIGGTADFTMTGGGDLATGMDAAVTLHGDTTVGTLVNNGTLNLTDGALTVTNLTNAGTLNLGEKAFTLEGNDANVGTIIAGDLTVSGSGNTATAITADNLTLGAVGNTVGDMTVSNLVFESLEGVTDTEAAMSLTGSNLSAKVTVDFTDEVLSMLTDTTAGDTYKLISGTLTADAFEMNSHAAQSLYMAGKTFSFETGSLILKLADTEVTTAYWNVGEEKAGNGLDIADSTGKITNPEGLTTIQNVNVIGAKGIDLTDDTYTDLVLRNLTGNQGSSLSIKGDGDDTVSLNVNPNKEIFAGNGTLDQLTLDNVEATVVSEDGETVLEIDSVSLTHGAVLTAEDGSLATGALNAANKTAGTIGGKMTVNGHGGKYLGSYAEGTEVTVAAGADQTLAAGSGLTVAGGGAVTLVKPTGSDNMAMDALQMNGGSVNLGDMTDTTLTLAQRSAVRNGSVHMTVDSAKVGSGDTGAVVAAPGLDLAGSTLVIGQSDDATVLDIDTGKKQFILATLPGSTAGTQVVVEGPGMHKYFSTGTVTGDGLVVVTRNTSYFSGLIAPQSGNAAAGAGMLDDALLEKNPQATNPDGDLAQVMDALEGGALRGAAKETVAAAMAGASAAAMGVAFNSDVDRQLRAIRNRTTTMGLAECDRHEGLPYFNAWVNAEGDFNKLGADGTLAGYKMSSWGATLGVDVDFTNRLTAGLAVTAMQGDFTANSAEQATGDLDRIYVSAFARYAHRAWTHTFVATLGKADTSLERTVNYGTGSYTTKGDSDGTAFGLMYEAGYTKALDEDGSTCLQPLFNISYRHSSLGGYTETGSDAALRVGSADMDTVSFGLGARLQSVVGTSVYNRASLFECRALLRLDAGDRDAAVKSNFTGLAGDHSVKSAEVGAFGLELGAGLTLPMSVDAGNIFMDVSMDLRSGYSSVNGTVGYRINF